MWKNRPVKSSLLALGLSLSTASLARSAEASKGMQAMEPSVPPSARYLYSEGKQDPPGVLNSQSLDSIRQLALQLSSDRSWLTREVLDGLSTMSIHLDEVFAAAPRFIEVEGKLYRPLLEKVGDGWQSFDPKASPYLLFLNHETYDGLGDNYALGFEAGKERVLVETDLAKVAAVGLTLRSISPDEKPKGMQGVAGIASPIQLGAVQPRLRGPVDQDLLNLVSGAQADKSCTYLTAPVACSDGIPVCSSGSASPFFVLTSLMIKTDHEGTFKGNPEAELFPLRINPTSPVGGSSNVRTNWIFSGRTVVDLAGRSVYLPDVNNNYQWYPVAGLALFPASASHQWVATLVENDDDAGLLQLDRNRTNPVKLEFSVDLSKPFDYFDLLVSVGQFLLTLAFQSDSDDLWLQSLEVNNSRFCSQGLGAYPSSFVLDADEWAMQGHFACIDNACAPPPPGGGGVGGGGCGARGCTEEN
jgi:hypothetical protein